MITKVRFWIIAAIVLVIAAGIYIRTSPTAFLMIALMRPPDEYPVFMRDSRLTETRQYAAMSGVFSEFVEKRFPVGSSATDAIAEITGGGFEVRKSNPTSVLLLWKRHAGPCVEDYYVEIDRSPDNLITRTSASMHPVCL